MMYNKTQEEFISKCFQQLILPAVAILVNWYHRPWLIVVFFIHFLWSSQFEYSISTSSSCDVHCCSFFELLWLLFTRLIRLDLFVCYDCSYLFWFQDHNKRSFSFSFSLSFSWFCFCCFFYFFRCSRHISLLFSSFLCIDCLFFLFLFLFLFTPSTSSSSLFIVALPSLVFISFPSFSPLSVPLTLSVKEVARTRGSERKEERWKLLTVVVVVMCCCY